MKLELIPTDKSSPGPASHKRLFAAVGDHYRNHNSFKYRGQLMMVCPALSNHIALTPTVLDIVSYFHITTYGQPVRQMT